MKKSILRITFFMLLIIATMLIPNVARAETSTTIDFDYSKIKALGGETPKLYELDSEYGEILSQDWTDEEGNSIIGTNPETKFVIGKIYKYKARIKPNSAYDWIEISNPPAAIQGMSYSVGRDIYDDSILIVEISAVVPKVYNITINTSDGVNVNPSKNVTVYEMERQEFDISLDSGYELVSATANGVSILENDAYFDDTFGRLFNNKMEIWNVSTDIVVDIQAIKPIQRTLNIVAQKPKVGDLPGDVDFKLDSTEFEIAQVEWVELIEDREDFIFEPVEDRFENGKMYGVSLNLLYKGNEHIELNVNWNNEEVLVEKWSDTEFGVFCNIGKLDEEDNLENPRPNDEGEKKENKEDNSSKIEDNENNLENTTVIDNNTTKGGNNPQTGDNIVLYIVILAVSSIGIILTTKIKKNLKSN